MKPLKFEVNEYITIKLEKGKVNIYVYLKSPDESRLIWINLFFYFWLRFTPLKHLRQIKK